MSESFICPECGSHRLEEYCYCDGGVSEVFFKDGELQYGITHTFGDVVELAYRCAECGMLLDGVETPEDILGWCKEHQPDFQDLRCPKCRNTYRFIAIGHDGLECTVEKSIQRKETDKIHSVICVSCGYEDAFDEFKA